MVLTIMTLSTVSVMAEVKSWDDKGLGIYCDRSICRYVGYYDTETKQCWVYIGDVKREVFRLRSNTYNGYFHYDDCDYMIYVPYWPMNN